jgi:hypothetical protein
MQDIRDIYADTLTKLEAVRSRLLTELQELDYILENEICDAYGEKLKPESELEVVNNLNADISEVNRDIRLVESQIKMIETFLASNVP